MDKYKFNLGDKQLVKYVKLILIAVLLVVEILVCAQYATSFMDKGGVWRLIAVVISCFFLALLETVNSFAVKKSPYKIFFFVVETFLLLAISVLTGNSYLSTLYCVVLTQFYLSVDDMKLKTVMFFVSCALFAAAFIIGWVIVNKGASLYESIVQITGDCIFGIFVLFIDYAVTNFVIKFFKQNLQLQMALKEAEENRIHLEEAYKQLSETAVFEERNRIAKDIHDNAGHSMTTVIIQTEAAKLLIDKNPKEAKSKIISANIQAKNALEQMRESVHLLAGRPQAKTLSAELEEIIAQTVDGTSVKIRCDLDEIEVSGEVHRFLCNSLKECLANGLRHGKATAFYIELKKALSGLMLLISDNGCGTDGEVEEGFGLKGMRERAEALGGRCVCTSSRDDGFEVEITLPLNKKEK